MTIYVIKNDLTTLKAFESTESALLWLDEYGGASYHLAEKIDMSNWLVRIMLWLARKSIDRDLRLAA